jgi:hypothetical protein
VPLTHSADYEGREIFADRRVRSRLERLAFTQTMRLPLERWAGEKPPEGPEGQEDSPVPYVERSADLLRTLLTP